MTAADPSSNSQPTAGLAPADESASFVRPAGFSAWGGGHASDATRLRSLVGVFLRDLRRGLLRSLLWLAFLLPPIGLAIYVWGRTQIQAFAMPPGWDQAAFALQNLALSFRVGLAWALLLQAGLVAPTIARDIRYGALLLYFSRPVRRRHYLVGRTLAGSIMVALGLFLPLFFLIVAQAMALGLQPVGAGPVGVAWAFWPLCLAASLFASIAAALLSSVVGLACGVLARSPGLVPLLYGGAILGSVGLSWVGQLIWQRNSLARSVDLHHALEAPLTFALRLVDATAAPKFVLLDAGASLALWAALATLGWLTLERFIADPPLGRGRS